MLKGLLDIKVYDKNGNLKQHESGENLITDLSANILKTIFGDVNFRMMGYINNPAYMSDIQDNFQGILLFNNLLIEDKENYFKQLMTANVVGHADSLGLESEAAKYGIINSSASTVENNSITKVWNFGQGKAVGTINSVALCGDSLGRFGLDDENFIDDTQKPFVYTDTFKWANNQNLKLAVFNEYSASPKQTDAYTDLLFAFYKNGIIYGYTTSVANNQRTINIYKITLSKFYNKQNFGSYITNNNNTGVNIARMYADTLEPIATITAPGSSGYPNNFFSSAAYNNKIYFFGGYLNAKGKVLYIYDINSNTFTYNMNTNFAGTATVFANFGVNQNGIYLVNRTNNKIARYTENLIYVNDIEVDSKVIGNNAQLNIMNFTDDGLLLITNGHHTNHQGCITDLNNFKFINPDNRRMSTYKDFYYTFAIIGLDNSEINVNKINNCISTIKNLTNPVIKGESDEMVVTYKIIKTEV